MRGETKMFNCSNWKTEYTKELPENMCKIIIKEALGGWGIFIIDFADPVFPAAGEERRVDSIFSTPKEAMEYIDF